MDSGLYLETFFEQASDMLQKLMELYPDLEGLAIAYDQVSLARRINPSESVLLFRRTTEPYLGQIKTKDDAFFLKQDLKFEESVIMILNELKSVWTSEHTTDNIKETVWSYIQLLTTLSNRYRETLFNEKSLK